MCVREGWRDQGEGAHLGDRWKFWVRDSGVGDQDGNLGTEINAIMRRNPQDWTEGRPQRVGEWCCRGTGKVVEAKVVEGRRFSLTGIPREVPGFIWPNTSRNR